MRADNGDLPRVAAVPVTLLLLIALMSACGSSQSGSSASGHLETPTSQTSATPIVTADPGDPTLLPVPADVAFLQAPIAIQNEWRTYYATGAITVVPNSTVPFTRPATPPVVDATNGAVSSTTAQQWGDALMRETLGRTGRLRRTRWASSTTESSAPLKRSRGWCSRRVQPASA